MVEILGKSHGGKLAGADSESGAADDRGHGAAEVDIFRTTRGGELIPVATPFDLYPLLTGMLPPDIAARLVEHLAHPGEFWAKYPLPTVTMTDPLYAMLPEHMAWSSVEQHQCAVCRWLDAGRLKRSCTRTTQG
jgi:hypothetical protein